MNSKNSSELERIKACEDQINGLRGLMSEGQLALEAVQIYRINEISCPDWALKTIADCYYFFKNGAPISGWVHDQLKQNAPKTLGIAFAVADHKNFHAEKRRMRATLGPQILSRFEGINGLSKNETNYSIVGADFNLSINEVKEIVVKRRSRE